MLHYTTPCTTPNMPAHVKYRNSFHERPQTMLYPQTNCRSRKTALIDGLLLFRGPIRIAVDLDIRAAVRTVLHQAQ